MANCYNALILLLLSAIASDIFLPSRADMSSIIKQRRKLRKQLKRTVPDQQIFGESIMTDDLIRTPNVPNAKMLQLSTEERQKLTNIFGLEAIDSHREDLAIAKTIGEERGAHEHNVQWKDINEPVTGVNLEVLDEVRLDALKEENTIAETNLEQSEEQRSMLDPTVAKNLLEGLLTKVDGPEGNSVSNNGEPAVTLTHGHCNLHGLWLSNVAGAAIELIPVRQEGHIEIRTKIFDLPGNPEKSMITSQWTGKGVISSESPTTITIIFQEHLTEEEQSNENEDTQIELPSKLPKTAVFVGQCLVCENSPVLQGSWVVFHTQSCLPSANDFIKSHPESSTPIDTLYLLQR